MTSTNPIVPWVRLNAGTNQDARLIRAGFWGTAIWPHVLTMAKLHGWRGGKIPKDEFDAALLVHAMNGSVTDETVTRGVESGIKAMVAVGLLSLDGGYYVVRNWSKYQSDPSNADRQAAHRVRKRADGGVTEKVTRNGSNSRRDVTGRDGTSTSPSATSRTPSAAPEPGVAVVSGPGPSDAPPSGSPGTNGNGHGPVAPRILSPAENHARLTALCAAAGGGLESRTAAADADRAAAAEARRKSILATLGDPTPCDAPNTTTRALATSPTRTTSDDPQPSSSTRSTSTAPDADDAP